jgi:predicted regulator of Ras-like GTPase activity (Roadblock/LC7/MglB family)
VEKAGYLIHQCGSQDSIDTTTFATLGSNAYNAVQFMAQLVNEKNFTSMYQQGEHFSTLMVNVDENSLLVVVFPTHLTVGSMKYYASPAARSIAQRIEVASHRSPETGLDLSDLDPKDVQALFRKKN